VRKEKEWDREFLDEVIRKYLKDYDPVEQCVDFQLSSPMGSFDVKISSLGVAHPKEYVSSVEDRLIDAIDRKYRWADSPEGVMWALYLNGYSFREIAEIFGCSIGTVWSRVARFHKRVR